MNANDVQARIALIREDREHGATQLAREAARLFSEMASDRAIPDDQFAELFPTAARDTARARPNMASLLNLVGICFGAWLEAGGASNAAAARSEVDVSALQWIAKQDAEGSFVADHAAEVLSGTIITLSYSSTVLRVLEECWARGVLKSVFVAESRPLNEGRRTAAVLASLNIPTTLITDAEMGIFAGESHAAIVGADTIRPNGSLLNKAGTLLLALAARRCRVPFYAVAETHKIAPATTKRQPIELEEMGEDEVLAKPIPSVTVRNVYFDLTPARYLTGYITERGLLNRKDVSELAREVPGALLPAAW